MTSWERFVNAALLNSLWQGAAIAFILAVLLALLRRSDSRIRYGLCCIAMLALMVWPVVTASNVTKPSMDRHRECKISNAGCRSYGV